MRLLLLALCAAVAVAGFSDYVNTAMDLLSPARAKELYNRAGFGSDRCAFVPNPVQAVDGLLSDRVHGQEIAVRAIVEAVQSWDVLKGTHQARPLVMAFSGPTGVGKTKTSVLLGEALLAYRTTPPGSNNARPVARGYLKFGGEEFFDVTRPLGKYHEIIKQRLYDFLIECRGSAVVVLDEVQKLAPGVLDCLLPAISEQHLLTLEDGRTVDTSGVIFLLISDIGAPRMLDLILDSGGRRNVKTRDLMNAVKLDLNNQWDRLSFGAHIDQVAPFLPLSQVEIAGIFRKLIVEKSEQWSGELWGELRLTTRAEVHLSSPEFVDYILPQRSNGEGAPPSTSEAFAKYGARNVEKLFNLKVGGFLLSSLEEPYDPRAVIWVDVDVNSDEIVLLTCPALLAGGSEGPTEHCTEVGRREL